MNYRALLAWQWTRDDAMFRMMLMRADAAIPQGSPRYYSWLAHNRYTGKVERRYRRFGGLSMYFIRWRELDGD